MGRASWRRRRRAWTRQRTRRRPLITALLMMLLLDETTPASELRSATRLDARSQRRNICQGRRELLRQASSAHVFVCSCERVLFSCAAKHVARCCESVLRACHSGFEIRAKRQCLKLCSQPARSSTRAQNVNVRTCSARDFDVEFPKRIFSVRESEMLRFASQDCNYNMYSTLTGNRAFCKRKQRGALHVRRN